MSRPPQPVMEFRKAIRGRPSLATCGRNFAASALGDSPRLHQSCGGSVTIDARGLPPEASAAYRGRMARRPRFQLEDGIYHVTARGNRKQLVFYDDRDRTRFLDLL